MIRAMGFTMLAAALLFGPAAVAEEAPPPVRLAIRAEKILTIANGVIDHGVVLVRDGRIEAVGPAGEVAIPAGAEVVDAAGQWLMPGLVDLHNHSASFSMRDINDLVYQVNPELRALDLVAAESDALERAVAGGVTTVLLIPGSGSNLGGFGVLLKTAYDSPAEAIVRWPGAMKIAQAGNPERFGGDLGTTRAGMAWLLRDVLGQAKAYDARWSAYEDGSDPAPPERDLRLELIRKVVRREVPILVHTQQVPVVEATVRILHDEFGLRPILSHATFDSFKAAPMVVERGIPVNVGPRGLWFDGDRKEIVGIAAEWWRRGVRRLSLCTDAPVVPEEELMFQASVAVHLGLPEEAALRAVTLEPALAIGIADRVGSIEVGKDADFVLFTGSPVEVTSRVSKTFIAGRLVYDETRDGRRF